MRKLSPSYKSLKRQYHYIAPKLKRLLTITKYGTNLSLFLFLEIYMYLQIIKHTTLLQCQSDSSLDRLKGVQIYIGVNL